jgi:DNA repair exonuclease SbcCD nuclease subunit
MFRKLLIALLLGMAAPSLAQITIAQISDTHLGLKRAPDAADNLRRVVEMVSQRNPDAVVVSGDIGENPDAWKQAREILRRLRPPVYFVPGNHDENAATVGRYRATFGKNYYEFRVKNAIFVALDSQLLGNFEVFESRLPMPLSAEGQEQSRGMLEWLDHKADSRRWERPGGGEDESPLVFAVQHVPISRAGGFPRDPKPYWTVQEPYRTRELELLHRLGVKHVFAGHWHTGMVYQADGLTYRIAPATSWSPFGAPLGFALHTISREGDVKTEFVYLK